MTVRLTLLLLLTILAGCSPSTHSGAVPAPQRTLPPAYTPLSARTPTETPVPTRVSLMPRIATPTLGDLTQEEDARWREFLLTAKYCEGGETVDEAINRLLEGYAIAYEIRKIGWKFALSEKESGMIDARYQYRCNGDLREMKFSLDPDGPKIAARNTEGLTITKMTESSCR
jgi:hypothetical protein